MGPIQVPIFRYLRVRPPSPAARPPDGGISAEQLAQDASRPIPLRQINRLPDNAKRRVYRALIPPGVLGQFGIDLIEWRGPRNEQAIQIVAGAESGLVRISARPDAAAADDSFCLEIADNAFNGVNLNFLLLSDPNTPGFRTDIDESGRPTLFGTARRNLPEEERAMRAGLAPAQVRQGLGASRFVLQQLEAFLITLGHRSYTLEPLTYVSAWIFERRGFAYISGHKLMDDIHREFQPGGRLHQALDGSTPFRQPDQWRTVRGRAWAIHDGILTAIGARWDGLRLIKQIGRQAGVETFPGAVY